MYGNGEGGEAKEERHIAMTTSCVYPSQNEYATGTVPVCLPEPSYCSPTRCPGRKEPSCGGVALLA